MALLMVYHPTAHKGEETSCFRHPQRPEQKLAIPHRAQHSMALLMVYEPAAMPGRSPGCFMCISTASWSQKAEIAKAADQPDTAQSFTCRKAGQIAWPGQNLMQPKARVPTDAAHPTFHQ